MQPQPTSPKKKLPPGIEERHGRSCRSRAGGRCNCHPTYRAWVYDKRSSRKLREAFPTLAAARRWRTDALSAHQHGRLQAPSTRTLSEAAEAWLAGAEAKPPTVLNRSGRPYKPSVLRGYRHDLKEYVLKELGGARFSDLRRGDVQALADRLLGKGLSGSKVRNILIPLRSLYRHALERDEVVVSPCAHLGMPAVGGRRERTASPGEAVELLAALPKNLRPIYATAFYGGLRRGELRGLRWSDVDLAAGKLRVERSWDEVEGAVEPKSEKGTRTVPIFALLHDYLSEQKAAAKRGAEDFVFPGPRGGTFTPSHVRRTAAAAWKTANAAETKKAKKEKRDAHLLQPIGLHECRHTFVSLCCDAGLSLEEVGDLVGHSSTYMTDRYRHLVEGREARQRNVMNAYLAGAAAAADTASRVAQLQAPEEPEE